MQPHVEGNRPTSEFHHQVVSFWSQFHLCVSFMWRLQHLAVWIKWINFTEFHSGWSKNSGWLYIYAWQLAWHQCRRLLEFPFKEFLFKDKYNLCPVCVQPIMSCMILLFSWLMFKYVSHHQVFHILDCIPKLEFLNLTKNPLEQLDETDGHWYPGIKKLALNFTYLSWDSLKNLLTVMPW